jgi:hypothetical protein
LPLHNPHHFGKHRPPAENPQGSPEHKAHYRKQPKCSAGVSYTKRNSREPRSENPPPPRIGVCEDGGEGSPGTLGLPLRIPRNFGKHGPLHRTLRRGPNTRRRPGSCDILRSHRGAALQGGTAAYRRGAAPKHCTPAQCRGAMLGCSSAEVCLGAVTGRHHDVDTYTHTHIHPDIHTYTHLHTHTHSDAGDRAKRAVEANTKHTSVSHRSAHRGTPAPRLRPRGGTVGGIRCLYRAVARGHSTVQEWPEECAKLVCGFGAGNRRFRVQNRHTLACAETCACAPQISARPESAIPGQKSAHQICICLWPLLNSAVALLCGVRCGATALQHRATARRRGTVPRRRHGRCGLGAAPCHNAGTAARHLGVAPSHGAGTVGAVPVRHRAMTQARRRGT